MFVERFPDDRGQAHTLEAFVAALLLVAGLIFATQATAVTPLSASTSNQHIENQEAIGAADVLATTKERGDLKKGLLYWDDDAFIDAGEPGYYTGMVNGSHPLSDPFNESFDDRRVAFNVDVFSLEDGDRNRQRMVDMGEPSDNAATAAVHVPVYTDDRLYNDSSGAFDGDVVDETTYFAPPDPEAGPTLYAVLEVRITAWQI
ncbi:DUF7288 family protein [Halorubrum sp. DTA98]|uniref:DUF7288 family protein n=1 Tax=Halorubrum sp. DTA98 TaxID=3402163 RepID=UPI003AAFEBD4